MHVYTCTRAQMGIHTHRYVQLSARVLIRHLQRFACVIHSEREGTHFPLGREGSKLTWKRAAVITLLPWGFQNQPGIGKPTHQCGGQAEELNRLWKYCTLLHLSCGLAARACGVCTDGNKFSLVTFSQREWLTDKLTNAKQHRTCLLREEIVYKVSLQCELPWIYKTEALALSGPSYGSTLSME